MITAEATQTQTTGSAAAQAPAKNHDGMSFGDLLEVINPLQHIPIISTIYRELTGDTITPAARIAGDALYGGLMGLASSVVNEVVEGTTGKDIGGHIWATLFGDDDDAAKDGAAKPAANETASASGADNSGMPTNLLPPDFATAPAATTPAPAVATSDPAQMTPLNGPTSFYQTLQRGGHSAHGVPLNTTVPTGDSHRATNEAILKAQQSAQPNSQPGGNQPAQTPAPGLGTTGLSASTTPPPSVPAAPSLSPNAVPVPPANISDAMMKALDQYKAMALQDNAGNAAVASQNGVPVTALIN